MKLILTIMFFPLVMVYYMFKLVLSLIVGLLKLIGFVDTAWKL